MLPLNLVSTELNESRFPSILLQTGQQSPVTSFILMLDVNSSAGSEANPVDLPIWHARRVVGISLSNPHRGCLNNAVQPLYLAGNLFTHSQHP
jgi:hypothetical protein